MNSLKAIEHERATILKAHNDIRLSLGVSALSINSNLNHSAQLWAEECVTTGNYIHSKAPGLGENLAWGKFSIHRTENLVTLFKEWEREGNNFKNEIYPKCKLKANEPVGHYSQLVWEKTKEVGIGYAIHKDRECLVCQYWPRGNILGQIVYTHKTVK